MQNTQSNSVALPLGQLGLRAAGVKITNAEVGRLQQHLKSQGKPSVTFDEFVSIWDRFAPDDESSHLADQRMADVFSVFDPLGTGAFDADMFVHAMSTLGEKMDPEEVREILDDAEMGLGSGAVDIQRLASVLNFHSGPLV